MIKQRQEVRDFQWDRIHPLLVQLGYTGEVKKTSRRTRNNILVPFQVEVTWNPKVNVTLMAKAQLYATDAYPVTGKGEAVLHLWSMTGSPSPLECKRVAAIFTRNGIPARATTYKKHAVVAFDPGDWMNTPEID